MKTIFFITLFSFSVGLFAQTKEEIADVYFNRAYENFNENHLDLAYKSFNKAVDLIKVINKVDNASLGAWVYYQKDEYDEAKKYINLFFTLTTEKESIEYVTMLQLYVAIEDKIELLEEKKAKEEKDRKLKDEELKKIESLKKEWIGKADEFLLKVDTIYSFNKNNVALFRNDGKCGVVNEKGVVLIDAEEYVESYSFDNFYVLFNDIEQPTKIACFNGETQEAFELPSIANFSSVSVHFEKIMYPRGNGILVLYPNNSISAMFYDLKSKTILKNESEKDLLRVLKKREIIDKYKKDIEIKIKGNWYLFGGSYIGGGVFPLYLHNNSIYGYLFSVRGNKIVTKSDYNYLGSYYNKSIQVINGEDNFWIDANGKKTDAPDNEDGEYGGTSEIVKVDDKKYFIYKNIEGKKTIIKGDKEITTLKDYLLKNMDI